MDVVVVGAGIFGVTGAIAIAKRGHRVTLLEAGAIPHPLAESTDVSKAIRIDYGADEFYTSAMERALDGWRAWNAEWRAPLFHESGAMFVTRDAMMQGGFEHESFTHLAARGHAVERLDERAIASRSPLRGFKDGYFNPQGGWAESACVVERLTETARRAGVLIREHAAVRKIAIDDARATSVVLASNDAIAADAIVIAAGGWSASLVPEIAPCFRTTAQPVFHLAVSDDARAIHDVVFGADIARTGWYGFPARNGFVKIANHGAGRAMESSCIARDVTDEEQSHLREFLRASIPSLASAPNVESRVCVYCDTFDEHFWIAPHPRVANLVVATGGSGHAFKFAPLIGEWIARALDGDVVERFRWRADLRAPIGAEAARRRAE